jgi:hypothetical protein
MGREVQDLGSGAMVFRVKAPHFGANGGDVCRCRKPLEGVIVGTLPALGLQVKTLDRHGIDNG